MNRDAVQRAVEAAESIPLLGRTRVDAMSQIEGSLSTLDPERFPALCLRLIIRRFLAHPVTPESLEQLSTAEQWAAVEQTAPERVRIQLLWCAFVGRRFPGAVPHPLLETAIQAAKDLDRFPVEWRLAQAAIDPERATTLRRDALAMMPSPADDSLRIMTLLDLADDLTRGSDGAAALRAIEDAVALARVHDDPNHLCQTLLRKALALLHTSRKRDAVDPLSEAFAFACELQDDLATLIAGIPLSAIMIDGGQPHEARRIAHRILVSGARRANWFAVVDGHITLSTVHRMEGDEVQAIEQLVRAAVRLRELIPAGALNALKGRLAELRNEIGPAVFDAHYRTAVDRHNAPS